jgi:transposase
MKEKLRFLGLDIHAETIAVAIAEPDGEVRSLGTIPNRAEPIRRLIKKLGPAEKLRACYEAGPTGYIVYWQLADLGIQCEVVAPPLVPAKAGDRVGPGARPEAAKQDQMRARHRLIKFLLRSGQRTRNLANDHTADWSPQQ